MNSVPFRVGNIEYQLRLTSKYSVELERQLGMNPMAAIMVVEGEIPRLEPMIQILHASLQALNHGISLSDTYDIFDQFAEDGGDLMGLVEILMEVFSHSGFFKKAAVEKAIKKSKK
jgi:hypothetical protein